MFEKSVDFFNLGGDRIGIVQSYIARLRICCGDDQDGKKRIESFLESANKNNAYAMLYEAKCSAERAVEATKENYLNCFVKRLKLMTDYAEDVYKKFENEGDGYWIESTGSDPHQDGKHALFLINKDTEEKLVYKPRDLSADFAILGKTPKGADGTLPLNKNNRPISSSMFEKMNKKIMNKKNPQGEKTYGAEYETNEGEFKTEEYKLGEESPLATMEIDKESHTEEFVSKQKEMTPEEAKKYFYKAGILDVATKIMAVADLHCDNIMPSGESNPMIIDPEVAFLDYAGAGLSELDRDIQALRQDINPVTNEVSNSFFMINEGGRKIKSGVVFSDPSSIYYQEYKKGYNFMVRKIKNPKMKASLLKQYTKLLGGFEGNGVRKEGVGKIRILPLNTSECSVILNAAAVNNLTFDEIANIAADDIKKNIAKMMDPEQGNFIFNNNEFRINFDDDALKEAIKKTLENGTIISMYINVEDGGMFLGDDEVARFSDNGGNQINRTKIMETATQKLKNAIDNLALLA